MMRRERREYVRNGHPEGAIPCGKNHRDEMVDTRRNIKAILEGTYEKPQKVDSEVSRRFVAAVFHAAGKEISKDPWIRAIANLIKPKVEAVIEEMREKKG